MIGPVDLPPPVRPGARIGVAALSGPVDPVPFERGLRALEEAGFEPVLGRNVLSRSGLFAGDDAERLDAFHELAADPDLEAILFARGGWGVLRLLDGVDWRLLAERPRAYVGYSDLTPFLLQVPVRLGVASFHGPMVAPDFGRGLRADEWRSFRAALAGEAQVLAIEASGDAAGDDTIEAPLLGGCLSLLASVLGTPWAVDLEGSLVFVEDVAEPPYRLDRMLTHLRLSGTLTAIRGLIAGHFVEAAACEPEGLDRDSPSRDAPSIPWRTADVLRDAASGRWPLALGLSAGHGVPNLTLPLGRSALLDPVAGRLTVGRPGGSAGTDSATNG